MFSNQYCYIELTLQAAVLCVYRFVQDLLENASSVLRYSQLNNAHGGWTKTI